MTPGYVAALSLPIVLVGLAIIGIVLYGLGRAVGMFHVYGVDYPHRPLPRWLGGEKKEEEHE